MELLQLRYFLDAAELENFSNVAKKNTVPQPYISKTIKKLEEELGVALFDRNGKKVSLNKNGLFFYNKVKIAISNIDDGIAHFSENVQTDIKIYIQAGNRYISMLTADFLTSTKDIYVSSLNSATSISITDYDFTFMQPMEDMSDFRYKELMKDKLVVAVSNKNPLSKLTHISFKDLKGEKFVSYYKTMNLRSLTDNYCKKYGNFTPNVVFETADASALRYMLEKNEGLFIVPEKFFMLQPSYKVTLLPLDEPAFREIIIAWDKNKKLSPQANHFKNFTVDWFKAI